MPDSRPVRVLGYAALTDTLTGITPVDAEMIERTERYLEGLNAPVLAYLEKLEHGGRS